jgi:hypothetical protein
MPSILGSGMQPGTQRPKTWFFAGAPICTTTPLGLRAVSARETEESSQAKRCAYRALVDDRPPRAGHVLQLPPLLDALPHRGLLSHCSGLFEPFGHLRLKNRMCPALRERLIHNDGREAVRTIQRESTEALPSHPFSLALSAASPHRTDRSRAHQLACRATSAGQSRRIEDAGEKSETKHPIETKTPGGAQPVPTKHKWPLRAPGSRGTRRRRVQNRRSRTRWAVGRPRGQTQLPSSWMLIWTSRPNWACGRYRELPACVGAFLGASGCLVCPRVREFGLRQGTGRGRRNGDASLD